MLQGGVESNVSSDSSSLQLDALACQGESTLHPCMQEDDTGQQEVMVDSKERLCGYFKLAVLCLFMFAFTESALKIMLVKK